MLVKLIAALCVLLVISFCFSMSSLLSNEWFVISMKNEDCNQTRTLDCFLLKYVDILKFGHFYICPLNEILNTNFLSLAWVLNDNLSRFCMKFTKGNTKVDFIVPKQLEGLQNEPTGSNRTGVKTSQRFLARYLNNENFHDLSPLYIGQIQTLAIFGNSFMFIALVLAALTFIYVTLLTKSRLELLGTDGSICGDLLLQTKSTFDSHTASSCLKLRRLFDRLRRAAGSLINDKHHPDRGQELRINDDLERLDKYLDRQNCSVNPPTLVKSEILKGTSFPLKKCPNGTESLNSTPPDLLGAHIALGLIFIFVFIEFILRLIAFILFELSAKQYLEDLVFIAYGNPGQPGSIHALKNFKISHRWAYWLSLISLILSATAMLVIFGYLVYNKFLLKHVLALASNSSHKLENQKKEYIRSLRMNNKGAKANKLRTKGLFKEIGKSSQPISVISPANIFLNSLSPHKYMLNKSKQVNMKKLCQADPQNDMIYSTSRPSYSQRPKMSFTDSGRPQFDKIKPKSNTLNSNASYAIIDTIVETDENYDQPPERMNSSELEHFYDNEATMDESSESSSSPRLTIHSDRSRLYQAGVSAYENYGESKTSSYKSSPSSSPTSRKYPAPLSQMASMKRNKSKRKLNLHKKFYKLNPGLHRRMLEDLERAKTDNPGSSDQEKFQYLYAMKSSTSSSSTSNSMYLQPHSNYYRKPSKLEQKSNQQFDYFMDSKSNSPQSSLGENVQSADEILECFDQIVEKAAKENSVLVDSVPRVDTGFYFSLGSREGPLCARDSLGENPKTPRTSSTDCSFPTVSSVSSSSSSSSDSTLEIVPSRRLIHQPSQQSNPIKQNMGSSFNFYCKHHAPYCNHNNYMTKLLKVDNTSQVARYHPHNAIRLTNEAQARQYLFKNAPMLPAYTNHHHITYSKIQPAKYEFSKAYVNHSGCESRVYRNQDEIRASFPSVIFRKKPGQFDDEWEDFKFDIGANGLANIRRCSSLSHVHSPSWDTNDDLDSILYIQHGEMDKFLNSSITKAPRRTCKHHANHGRAIRKSSSLPNFKRLIIREKIKQFH